MGIFLKYVRAEGDIVRDGCLDFILLFGAKCGQVREGGPVLDISADVKYGSPKHGRPRARPRPLR